ncbi:ligand-binding sensor domain-containing protein [Aureispira anguillae]|uniref:Two component regulator propeller n=1 Tax=Aureispira anguillae TaxID=2864201 RepID=A0A915YED3_9BACT|nr:two-component regulator propeller domain-containing protein [Aureispira anguillae]BDS11564.1 hypothetical protein AsAng_0022780 [Aureispira anguillae]
MIFALKSYSLLILAFIIIACNDPNLKKSDTNTPAPRALNDKITMPKNGFNSGLLDSRRNLWFGSNGGGLYCYNGSTFVQYTEDDGLCNNQLYSIIEDQEHNLWLGTQNGLCNYNRKIFTHISIPFKDTTSSWLDEVYPIINPNAVHSLAQDKENNIWIGTAGGGAYCYDGMHFNAHLSEIGTKQPDSLYHNWIPSIAEDSDGNIWLASMTHGGVSRYDGKIFTQFMPKDGLSDDMVRTIFKDRSGKLWFGFNGNRGSALTFYDGKTFKNLTKEDGLCSTSILAIFEDKKGNIWLGSGRGNLCIYDGESFAEFTSKTGETFSEVFFILSDSDENIWFGGKNGLWQFDGEAVINMME